MSDPAPSPYSVLPKEGPYQVAIGSALITMVEPHPGHDHAYNRWYEDDHYYAGAMAMPWMFAGRRWVAPRRLQALRYPSDSGVAQPVDAGKYLSLYWITAGRYEDHLRWTVATNQRLLADGRVYQDRTHVFTAFQEYLGVTYRDAAGPRDVQSLDFPFGGLVLEVIDAASAETRASLLSWLEHERAPRLLAGSPVAMVLYFTPMPLPADKMAYAPDVPGVGRRITALWFVEGDPADIWESGFAGSGAEIEATGLGRLELAAPFVPTVPGTDTYVDELRA